jgi:hypothetical protein
MGNKVKLKQHRKVSEQGSSSTGKVDCNEKLDGRNYTQGNIAPPVKSGKVGNMNRDNFHCNAFSVRKTEQHVHDKWYNDADSSGHEHSVREDKRHVQNNEDYIIGEEEEDERQDDCQTVQTNKLIIFMQEKKSLPTRRPCNIFREQVRRMDKQMVLQETVRCITRKIAWKTFKLVDEDDFIMIVSLQSSCLKF